MSAIRHVLVLMLENRSFDHLLAYSGIPGLTGVDTSKTNPGSTGPVAMSSTTPDRLASDPGHEFEDVDWQIYGTEAGAVPRPVSMNGFADRGWPEAMQCAAPALVPVFTQLARKFLVCDNWFSSMPGPTWPNRFFVHAASSGGLANSPSNLTTIGSMLWSKLGFSFSNGTIYDRLTQAGRSWRIYHGDHFPQVCAIDTMPSEFVADPVKFRRQNQLAADLSHGDVADYTFIEPDYSILSTFRNGNSQHPSGTLSAGEQLIHDVTSALMGSEVWQSSLLIIVYDEHGGLYDQAPPRACAAPGDDQTVNAGKAQNPPQPPFNFDRYGVRVPAVLVSPWVTPGSVSHETYDHASVIRTVFELFGIPGQLTNRDAGATSLVPLLKAAMAAAVTLAAPNPQPDPVPAPSGENIHAHTIDAFARIAAQIHHALLNYAPGMQPAALHRAVQASPDVSNLPDLPKTASQDESRAYIAKVAALVQAHRLRQMALRGQP
ncbi:MAG: alkaline phosphatase family protein [Terriglobales bacterium]